MSTTPELCAPVGWISWDGTSVCHAIAEASDQVTLCGRQLPTRKRRLWIPLIIRHLVASQFPGRCKRCERLAGVHADPAPPRPGEPSLAALDLLEEIQVWIAKKRHCPFHELSHRWTKDGREGMGQLLRELHLLGLVADGRDDSGLVSTRVIADDERVAHLLAGSPVRLVASPRSRCSALAERVLSPARANRLAARAA
jgi:hypothetical protein